MIRMEGPTVARERQGQLSERVVQFTARTGRPPALAVIILGEDPASQIYVRNKVRRAKSLGIKSLHLELPAATPEQALLDKIEELNRDRTVDGILVQLPVPKHIRPERVIRSIRPEKDPDGLNPENLGLLVSGRRRVAPCTPLGVMAMLAHYQIPLKGRHATVVGRSNTVGMPMAHLLLSADATVTVCHSKTKDLQRHTREADLVVVAAGRARFLGREAFSKNSVVIDVGIHRPTSGDFSGRLCGDVRFEELHDWAHAATPVPGGVGPMTIQMLMENTVHLAETALGAKSTPGEGH